VIFITADGGVILGGICLRADEVDQMAIDEGFDTRADFIEWAEMSGEMPFYGHIIKWRKQVRDE
jgi:hypothetical protein